MSRQRGSAPASTYRLQVRAEFDLDAAAAVVPYLRDLGVDWAYLSPILQAASGSAHGYDVVDPTRVDEDRGGAPGLARFSAAARAAGLGILVDIVPNHQGVATPAENPWWWDVLTHGETSRHADAFDIDWRYGGGRVRLPVLGGELDEVLARGEIEVAPPAEGALVSREGALVSREGAFARRYECTPGAYECTLGANECTLGANECTLGANEGTLTACGAAPSRRRGRRPSSTRALRDAWSARRSRAGSAG